MKDKRNLLKIGAIIEIIYVFIMCIYYFFNAKNNDELIANIFLLAINLCFAIFLYRMSKKEISQLKANKIPLVVVSCLLFLDSIIPGVLGFFFLKTISDKKITKLPEIKQEKPSSRLIIKSLCLLFLFLVFMYVLPMFSFFEKIPLVLVYIILFLSVLLCNIGELKKHFRIFIRNIKVYIPYIIKNYFKMLGFMLIVAVPIILINNGGVSNNQDSIIAMFEKMPLFTFLLSCLYAPFVEETLFRYNLSKLISNKKLFIILSGFIFGLLHVVGKFSSLSEFLYVFQYSALGIYLAKTYKESNNIFVTISMHFIQNFLAAILVLILF